MEYGVPTTRNKLATNPACKGFTKGEGEVADEHRTRISQDTDGVNEGEGAGESNGSGLGTILEGRNGSERMGKHGEAYGAQVLALLRGLETEIEFRQAMREKTVRDRRMTIRR